MKAYTDKNQSKKLAKILSNKTSDMYYWCGENIVRLGGYKDQNEDYDIPCWSLAALLDVLESEIDGENGETYKLNIEKDGTWWDVWYCEEHDEENPIETTSSEELIDVCYKMILKLKERKLI